MLTYSAYPTEIQEYAHYSCQLYAQINNIELILQFCLLDSRIAHKYLRSIYTGQALL